MNHFQQKRINSAVHFSEQKQQTLSNFINIILNKTLLKTESITRLQINTRYQYKDDGLYKTKVKKRPSPYFGFERE